MQKLCHHTQKNWQKLKRFIAVSVGEDTLSVGSINWNVFWRGQFDYIYPDLKYLSFWPRIPYLGMHLKQVSAHVHKDLHRMFIPALFIMVTVVRHLNVRREWLNTFGGTFTLLWKL